MPDWISPALIGLLSGGGGAGLWAWLAARAKAKADAPAAIVNAAASLQAVLSEEAKRLVADMRSEMDGLRTRIAALEGENAECRGENAQLVTRLNGLEGILRENGIAIPERPPADSLMVIEGDNTTVFKLGASSEAEPKRAARRKSKGA